MVIPDKLEFNIEGFKPEVKRSAFYTTEELEQQAKAEEKTYNKKLDKIEKIYEELKKDNENNEEQEEKEI